MYQSDWCENCSEDEWDRFLSALGGPWKRHVRLHAWSLTPLSLYLLEFSLSQIPWIKRLLSWTPFCRDVSALQSANCRLNPQKLWTKLNFSFKLWVCGIVFQWWELWLIQLLYLNEGIGHHQKSFGYFSYFRAQGIS